MTQQSGEKTKPKKKNSRKKGMEHLIIISFALVNCSYMIASQGKLPLFQPGKMKRNKGIWFKIIIQDADSV